MKAYKGFNDDLTCRGFQYEEGKSYHEDKAVMCESGFHVCLNPIHCLDFYYPNLGVYHEVEINGITEVSANSTKVCGTDITIGKRLSVKEMCEAHFEYVKDHIDDVSNTCNVDEKDVTTATATSVNNNCAVAITGVVSGYDHNAFEISNLSVASGKSCSSFQGKSYDTIAAGARCLISVNDSNVVACADENMVDVGDGSVIASENMCSVEAGDFNVIATGRSSHVKADGSNIIAGNYFSTIESGQNSTIVGRGRCSGGPNSVIVARGYGVQVKGGLGSILVIAAESTSGLSVEITDYCVGVVDGVKIKPDTWYKLHNGEFIEVDENLNYMRQSLYQTPTGFVTDNEGEDDDG